MAITRFPLREGAHLMKLQSSILAMTVAFGTVINACSGTTDNGGTGGKSGNGGATNGTGGATTTGSGGTTASGTGGGTSTGNGGASTGNGGAATGSGGASAGGNCSSVTACGGDVTGSWNVTSSCLKVSGDLDLISLGLGCKSGTVSGSLNVTGTWSAKSDTTYMDGTTTKGTLQITLPPSCLMISGTTTTCSGISSPLTGIGLSDADCTPAADGGCSCVGTVDQMGGIGLPDADPQKSGNYATANNVITNDSKGKHDYCVSGNTMNWTPQGWFAKVSGSISFQKSGTSGSGGAGGMGTGGSGTGSGGATNAGGSSAGGTNSGGAKSTGGSTGSGGSSASGGMTGAGGSGSGSRTDGPCDIYAAANTPCAAAYSTVRALRKGYTGPLYQVRSGSSTKNTGSGGQVKDIGMTADGFADTAAQDAFCSGTLCTFSILYDQSGNGNDLKVAKKGSTAGGATGAEDDYESSATHSLMVSGHKVYSLYMAAHEGYRLQAVGKNMPRGSAAEGIYELADGKHVGGACCWDFGNVTTNPLQYHTMNTLFFGVAYWGRGQGEGPWFMADFEAGVWAGGSKKGDAGWGSLNDDHPPNNSNPSMKVAFALGVLKTTQTNYTLRSADLSTASNLTTSFSGALPKAMDNQGGIVLGVGGDNSNYSYGTFFEGAITVGAPSDATDLAVMNNVKAANYGK
jgi:hypothetical protein